MTENWETDKRIQKWLELDFTHRGWTDLTEICYLYNTHYTPMGNILVTMTLLYVTGQQF